jgi:hypothetical protein
MQSKDSSACKLDLISYIRIDTCKIRTMYLQIAGPIDFEYQPKMGFGGFREE